MTVQVAIYPGIAFHDVDKCTDHDDCVIAVMVGDDFKHHVNSSDVSELPADDYCSICGQIGCDW